jgi:hypothetical protein
MEFKVTAYFLAGETVVCHVIVVAFFTAAYDDALT